MRRLLSRTDADRPHRLGRQASCIGQLAASTGFLAYSLLLANWLFVVSNAAPPVTASIGR